MCRHHALIDIAEAAVSRRHAAAARFLPSAHSFWHRLQSPRRRRRQLSCFDAYCRAGIYEIAATMKEKARRRRAEKCTKTVSLSGGYVQKRPILIILISRRRSAAYAQCAGDGIQALHQWTSITANVDQFASRAGECRYAAATCR